MGRPRHRTEADALSKRAQSALHAAVQARDHTNRSTAHWYAMLRRAVTIAGPECASDADLAELLGITRERVGQVRREVGA